MTTNASSSKWSVVAPLDARKRTILPPISDDYAHWTLDQLKLECTARKLNVAKNTKKHERVSLLQAWDTNKEDVQVLLRRQRKRSKKASEEEEKRTSGCMFRLINVLFSSQFFESFLATGHQLRRDELDDGGSTFWVDVATAFATDTEEYDALISDDANFEGANDSKHMAHSAAKLKRMWKELSSNLARAEARSKVSGQGSNDFWDFYDGRADVYYLDRWCEHRQAGREFCVSNMFAGDEDDSTQEGNVQHKTRNNRKRRKSSQADEIVSFIDRIDELFGGKASQLQEETWKEQKLFIQEQRTAKKLSTLSSMLTSNAIVMKELSEQRRECHVTGIDAADIGRELTVSEKETGVGNADPRAGG